MQSNTVTRKVPIDSIHYNPQNNRSMEPEDIAVLAGTIARRGLLQPPVVYEENGEYVLLGGHRRVAALRQIQDMIEDGDGLPDGSPLTLPLEEIEVIVVPKPANKFQEQQLLTEGNIHRWRPEELQNEIQLSKADWNAFSEEERDQCREVLLRSFTRLHKGTPAYEKDPKKFIRDNFRPADEYIRFTTGQNISKNTIKKIEQTAAEAEDEKNVADENKSQLSTEVLLKKVCKQAKSLIGVIALVDSDDPIINGQLDACSNELESLVALIEV